MSLRRGLACLLLTLPLLAATRAGAAELGSNRLVAGGATQATASALKAPAFGDIRLPVVSGGGFSLGGLAEPVKSLTAMSLPFLSSRGSLAVGGYVAYGQKETRLSSSLTSDGGTMRADISAAYVGGLLGADSAASLSLGSAWARPQTFSPNPSQPGLALADPYPSQAGSDINLSLSLMHQMTPSLSFGGIAQASKISGSEDKPAGSGFMLGAGLGLKF